MKTTLARELGRGIVNIPSGLYVRAATRLGVYRESGASQVYFCAEATSYRWLKALRAKDNDIADRIQLLNAYASSMDLMADSVPGFTGGEVDSGAFREASAVARRIAAAENAGQSGEVVREWWENDNHSDGLNRISAASTPAERATAVRDYVTAAGSNLTADGVSVAELLVDAYVKAAR